MERVRKRSSEAANSKRVAQGKHARNAPQDDIASRIDNSPHMLSQRKKLHGLFGGAAQLQGAEDEMLQGKLATAQRVEDEEPEQGKFANVQRVEDEEPLQGKFDAVQRVEEEEPLQGKFSAQATAQLKTESSAKPNNTGLPDNLKSGIENLSGMSMDNVKVHYNSSQPAQLNALAYAQGSDIHVAPGQEQHLPHEAWHVVQQAQGRVQPTMQMKEGVPINDDRGLEREADVMGAKALQMVGGLAGLEPRISLKHQGIDQRTKGSGAVIQAQWDVAVKPKKRGEDGIWYIDRVVIEDRPSKPETSGLEQEGGKSFHHESAWTLVEKQVTQFEGCPLSTAIEYLVRYGLTGMGFPPMIDPGPGNLDRLEALNNYFFNFLSAKAKEASGWLGPTGTHSSQGGRISQALKKLKEYGFSRDNILHALNTTFEPSPSIEGEALFEAARSHADIFYAAYQLYLEEDPSISMTMHEDILEILKDWETQYWTEPTNF